MGNTYTIRIRSGSNSVKRYRFSMWWKRYIFNPRSNGRGFYEKKDCSKWEKNKMFHFCRRRKLSLDAVPTQYTRSRNYRNEFFAKNKTVSGRYRCAYCGRKLEREKITIDHIFPVHCMEEYPAVRKRAALFGIRGSNDLKNLVPACRRCNLRKGTRMGWWIIKGFLGRTWWYWPVRKLLRLTVILAVAYLCGYTGMFMK